MSRLNVNSVNPHDGTKVSITGSTNGGVVISGSGDNKGNPLLAVHGTISASGNLTASNAFISENVHIKGNIYVEGHTTLSAYTHGGIQLGDTNTDNVTFGADVNSSIIPNINNTYDLGSDAQEWRNIYVEGTGYIDTIIQDDSSITNTFKGDSQFIDDAGSVSLQVHSSDGNIGVKVSDPNVDFEVAGNMSSSGFLSLGGAGSANGTKGHLTASGNAIISGTLEVLGGALFSNVTASNISASNHLYGGLNTFTSRINSLPNRTHLLITTPITASSTISASLGILASGYRVDGLILADGVNEVLTIGDTNWKSNQIKGNTDVVGHVTASELLVVSTGSSRIQMDGAGNLPTIDNDTVAIFQRNLPGGATAAITILGHVAGESILKFGDTADEDIGRIRYMHSDDSMDFLTNNTQQMSIDSSGNIKAEGNISSSGVITAEGLIISDDALITDDLTVHGNISGSSTSTLTIGGLATFGTNTLILNGTHGHMTMSGNISGSSTSSVFVGTLSAPSMTSTGTISSSNSIVSANITASNNLTVFGDLVGKGNVALGDNTADKITLIGNVTSSGIMDFTNTTNATDASGDTGALRVEGGISVAQSIFAEQLTATENIKAGAMISSSANIIGKNITSSNNTRVDGDLHVVGNTQLGNNTDDTVKILGNITSSGIIDITSTVNAIDATGDTGAIRTEGGVSVAQDVYAAGTFFATTEGFAASTVHTGFISSSGTLVGQNVTASNNLKVEGAAIFNGTTQLGNTTVDTVTVIGNITHSGTTALGNAVTDFVTMTGNLTGSAAGTISQSKIFTDEVTGTGVTGLTLGTNITSSGEISASLGFIGDIVGTASFATSLNGGTLTATKLFVGNGSNVATQVALSGDVTMNNAGAVTIGADKVDGSKLTNDVVIAGDLSVTTDFVVSQGHTTLGNITSSGTTTLGEAVESFVVMTGNLTGSAAGTISQSRIITDEVTGVGTTGLTLSTNVSASAEIGALVLHGRNSGSSVVNSGGAISTTITEAAFPGKTVFGINQSTADNAVAFTLPAATIGLEYTFIASVTSGNTTTTFTAPSAILKGVAICSDANESISGTNFVFSATKFIIGTRVTCIADGAIWHVTAICPCAVGDVASS